MKKYFLPILITFSALAVSLSAAFYSVSGLSKLFAGATIEVIIMASSLEVAKLVIASFLHQNWKQLSGLLKYYLTSAIAVLVLITSMGIYGFLSAAYQQTASKEQILQSNVEFLQQKESFFEKDVSRYETQLSTINNTINNLSKAKVTQIQVKDTSIVGGVRNTVSTSELRLAQQRLDIEETKRKETESSLRASSDSLQSTRISILELQNSNEVSADLGPLKYLSEVTGIEMKNVVNVLLLLIVFVFDPLAVALIIAANYSFKQIFLSSKEKEVEGIFKNPKKFIPKFDEQSPLLDTAPMTNPLDIPRPWLYDDPTFDPGPSSSKAIKKDFPEFLPQWALNDPVNPWKPTGSIPTEYYSSSTAPPMWTDMSNEEIPDEVHIPSVRIDEQKQTVEIKDIVQKTPSHVSVITEEGKRVKVPKENYNPENSTISYKDE